MLGLTIFQLKNLSKGFAAAASTKTPQKRIRSAAEIKTPAIFFFHKIYSFSKNQAAAQSSSLKLITLNLHQGINFFSSFMKGLCSAFFAAQNNVACVDKKLFGL